MAKKIKLSLVLMLLLRTIITEAKSTLTRDEIDVASVHMCIQNSAETRQESISADITGNTLTITFND